MGSGVKALVILDVPLVLEKHVRKEGPDVKEDLWFWDGKHFLDEGRERYNDG